MRVLVTVASRHGATAEIGSALAGVLLDAGVEVDRTAPDRVVDLAGYDAVIIGSAIYLGRWMDAAIDLVDRHEAALRARPVWLFSSGPVGDPPIPPDGPEGVAELAERIGARDHRLFGGDVDRAQLGLGEKVILTAVRAPEGDYRGWPEIRAWAAAIAAELADGPAADAAATAAESSSLG